MSKLYSLVKTARIAILLVACAVALQFVSIPSAHAYNTCNTGYSDENHWYFADCSGTTGSRFRVYILCQNVFSRSAYYTYGLWETMGGPYASTVNCPHWYDQKLGDWVNYQIQ